MFSWSIMFRLHHQGCKFGQFFTKFTFEFEFSLFYESEFSIFIFASSSSSRLKIYQAFSFLEKKVIILGMAQFVLSKDK